MKRFLVILTFAALSFGMQSCNESRENKFIPVSFVTVQTLGDAKHYFFELDGGKTIYPSDISRVANYEAKSGQRAVLAYELLEEKLPGYDFNAIIYQIADIYTGSAKIVSTAEALAKFKDDKIRFEGARLSDAYLSLQVTYVVGVNSKHNFDLICNETTSGSTPTNEG